MFTWVLAYIWVHGWLLAVMVLLRIPLHGYALSYSAASPSAATPECPSSNITQERIKCGGMCWNGDTKLARKGAAAVAPSCRQLIWSGLQLLRPQQLCQHSICMQRSAMSALVTSTVATEARRAKL